MLGSHESADLAQQPFSLQNTKSQLEANAAMARYRLYLEYMLDMNEPQKIIAKIGQNDATLFYDGSTCVILCNPGAYYCDCDSPEQLEDFCKCRYNDNIQISTASLQDNVIVLTAIDHNDQDQTLRIQMDRPYCVTKFDPGIAYQKLLKTYHDIYNVQLDEMKDLQGKNDLQNIEKKIGNDRAKLFSDGRTCVFQCDLGAYRCDCTQEALGDGTSITIDNAAMNGNQILLYYKDADDEIRILKVHIDMPYT